MSYCTRRCSGERRRQPLAIDASRLTLNSPEELIGEGSWGRVVGGVLSLEGRRQQRVAVKLLPALGNAEQRQQFTKELKAHIVALQAEGVSRLFGTSELNGRMCLVMKRYETSLADKIKGRAMSPSEILKIALPLSRTLEQLHGLGLVVQDIKPSNILLDQYGMPVVADFGISDVLGRTTQVMPSSVRGTFNYMAPESFNPPLGPPVDVWALACVIVEMATGVPPWCSMQMQQIMFAVVMQKRTPDVPACVPAASTIQQCFRFEPRDRPTAAQLVCLRLHRFRHHHGQPG